MIYAADEGVTAAEHLVVEANKRLSVIALDLTAPSSKILGQIQSIASTIRRRGSPAVDLGERAGVA